MGFNIKEKLVATTRPIIDVENGDIEEDSERKLQELIEYNEKYPAPTAEEYQTLKTVAGHPPYVTFLVCLIEFSERASYYGVRDRLSNFVQLPLPAGGNGAGAPAPGTQDNAGALGLGLRPASAVSLLLTFLAYLTPLWGGYLADKRTGRLRTIWYGVIVGFIAHVILIIAAIPSVITGGAALAPTIIAIITLAFGTGFIKPNLLPLLYDQYEHKRDYVRINDDGSKVIVSRESTLERVTLVYYWSINVGSFLSLGTSYCAKRVGFWLAFLVPGIAYMIMIPVLFILGPKFKKEIPLGHSTLEESIKVLRYCFRKGWFGRMKNRTFYEFAKPTNIIARGSVSDLDATNKKGQKKITWSDQFVDDVRVTMSACLIFAVFIIFNINDGGIGSIENSQSNSMTTNGVPNDLVSNFNALTIIVFIPIQNYILYPMIRKMKLNFRPVYRIFVGLIFGALSQVAGAIIQWKVYETSPCGYYSTDCDVGDGVSPITVWVEVVLYILGALGECFANPASYEIAYTRAPEHMKGLIMAINLSMSSFSAAISEACTASLIDPYLIWPFVACAIAGVVSALWFLWYYRNLHIVMEEERIAREEKLKQEFLDHMDGSKEMSDDALVDVISEKQLLIDQDLKNTSALDSTLSNRRP